MEEEKIEEVKRKRHLREEVEKENSGGKERQNLSQINSLLNGCLIKMYFAGAASITCWPVKMINGGHLAAHCNNFLRHNNT